MLGIKNLFAKKAAPTEKSVVKKAAASSSIYQEHQLNNLMGYLSNMPDLDETLLSAGIYRKDLRRLETDDEISAALETRLLGVMATPYSFESSDEASRLFVEEQIKPRLDDIIRQSWQAIPYGYAVAEAVYKRLEGGKIGFDQILYKPFWWFQPHPNGELSPQGLVEEKLDTRFKFFMTRRNPSYLMPYGEAVLSRLYWAWYFRQSGWDHWNRWLARFGTPTLVGAGGASNNLEELDAVLRGAVNAASIAVPEGTTVTAIDAKSGSSHFPEFETAVTKRIQKMILGQTLTTDVGKSGSFAAAKVHDGVRDDKRLADCKLISQTVQQMIDALVALNGLQPVTFSMEDARKLNTERATRDATLANASIVSFSREYLLRAYDFDDDDLAENLPLTPQNTAPSDVKAALSGDNIQFSSKKQRFTPAQQAIEALGDNVIRSAPQPISEDAIKMAIKTSNNADEMMDKLATLAEGYSSNDFAELSERALFAADVFGYVQSEQGKH